MVIGALWGLLLGASAMPDCSYVHGDKTSAKEIVAKIERSKGICAIPWRALKRIVGEPGDRSMIEAALDQLARDHPERADRVIAMKAEVAAAAGQPAAMLALADANVRAHPEDKSLANMSCFVRGAHGFDIEHAMPFCDAAVDGDGRPGWALINRGVVELALGRDREAMADFNEALVNKLMREANHPFLINAIYGRGIARLRLGDKGGRDDIAMAIRRRPDVALDFADAGIRP